eukprot:SAG31_NODE_2490_length_5614_cov_2.236990_1_plen_201_part_00
MYFRVLASAPLTAKYEPTSHVVGHTVPGQIVQAIQSRPLADLLRLQLTDGWASTKDAANGTKLLARVRPSEAASLDLNLGQPEANSGSEMDSNSEVSQQENAAAVQQPSALEAPPPQTDSRPQNEVTVPPQTDTRPQHVDIVDTIDAQQGSMTLEIPKNVDSENALHDGSDTDVQNVASEALTGTADATAMVRPITCHVI